jgi:hypothetical protein
MIKCKPASKQQQQQQQQRDIRNIGTKLQAAKETETIAATRTIAAKS